MIVYKRKLTMDDICNLDKDEELIYYKTDDVAIVVDKVNDKYVARKKRISDNELIEEELLKRVDEVMDFAQN